jgi:hypothetical protein
MSKWTIKYVVIDNKGNIENKTTDVFGVNMIDAYCNATKLLSIIEKKNKIEKLEVVLYN